MVLERREPPIVNDKDVDLCEASEELPEGAIGAGPVFPQRVANPYRLPSNAPTTNPEPDTAGDDATHAPMR